MSKGWITGRAVTILAVSALLAGCAVTVPTAIASSTGGGQSAQAITLAPFEEDGSLRANFGTALQQAFADHGAMPSENANLIAEFAVAERAADTGVADPQASSDDTVVWSSAPRNRRLFDACDARRLRATLVLLERNDGSLTYRGVAEATDCAFTDNHMAAMASALVEDAFAPGE